MIPNSLILGSQKKRALPSHGRGRRFNPYSAHHFTRVSRSRSGTTRQNTARTSKLNVEKSLNFVRGVFVSFIARFLTTATKRLLRAARPLCSPRGSAGCMVGLVAIKVGAPLKAALDATPKRSTMLGNPMF